MSEVQIEEKGHRGAFYLEEGGERLASLTFSAGPDGKVVMLDHTEVSPALRDQGVARKLVEAAVRRAREKGFKLVPVCPFAKAVFERKDTKENTRPLYGAPELALVLPQARTRNGVGQTTKDLTEHPWAGVDVIRPR